MRAASGWRIFALESIARRAESRKWAGQLKMEAADEAQ
jgi:hypothetical protein